MTPPFAPSSRSPGAAPARWMPHVTVATLTEREGRFLMIEETVNGELVLNQPAGHWERGETLMQAAVRETLEETGWDVEVTGLVGVYEYESLAEGETFLRFAFSARPLRHHPERALDAGIQRALWLSIGEVESRAWQHRSPMVQRACADYWLTRRHPLNVLVHMTERRTFTPVSVATATKAATTTGPGSATSSAPSSDDDDFNLRPM